MFNALTFSSAPQQKEPENYEQVLEGLRLSITARQSRLAEIRQRERRASLWVTLYLFIAWALYGVLWYTGWITTLFGGRHKVGDDAFLKKALMTAPVLVGPVVRIVQLWYTRIGNKEEETLKNLLLEQRSKVEEIKKKTDFYSTQKLLERYDRPDANTLATPAKKPNQPRQSVGGPGVGPRTSMGPPGQPQGTPMAGNLPSQNVTPRAQMLPPGINGTPMPPGFMSAYSPQPLQPTPRRWYDRIADAVLGEEEGPGGASTKYALICKKCFTHNGLVPERDYETTQFVCMKCGFLNPAPKAQSQPNFSLSVSYSPDNATSPVTPMTSHTARDSSPVSPSPSNPPNVSGASANATKGYDVHPKEEDSTDEDIPPPKTRGKEQKLTKRRSTRNSRKSEMELD